MRGVDAMQEGLFTVAKLDDFVPDLGSLYVLEESRPIAGA